MKLRSLGLCSRLLVAAAPWALGGCVIIDDDDSRHHRWDDDHGWEDPDASDPPPVEDEPVVVSITPDAVLESEPGEGVGIFVQYAAGGTWKVWTTCDTNTSREICLFDVRLALDTSSELLSLTEEDLEGPDKAAVIEDGVVQFHAETGSDLDVLTFTTTPGALVRLEVLLNRVSAPEFVYWFGDDVLHEGAPTNPVDILPSQP